MWFFSPPLSVQFLMYIDSVGSGSPMDMETDGPMLDDVNMLKKTVEEEATQVRSVLLTCLSGLVGDAQRH